MRRALFFLILLGGTTPQLLAQTYYDGEGPRFEVGAQLNIHYLNGLQEWGGGFGVRFNYNFNDHVALDSELVYRQHDLFSSNGTPTPSATIGQTSGLFGVRAGQHAEYYGVFAHARAGFLHFGTSNGASLLNRSTVPAFNVGGTFERYHGPVILRFDLGELIVAYGNAQATGSSFAPPPPGRLGTRASPIAGFGFGVRF